MFFQINEKYNFPQLTKATEKEKYHPWGEKKYNDKKINLNMLKIHEQTTINHYDKKRENNEKEGKEKNMVRRIMRRNNFEKIAKYKFFYIKKIGN